MFFCVKLKMVSEHMSHPLDIPKKMHVQTIRLCMTVRMYLHIKFDVRECVCCNVPRTV
jgi:hypothetical protein